MAKRGRKQRPRSASADPLAGSPEKPPWLDPEASRAWDELEALLAERRVLSRCDGPALAVLCSTWSGWRKAAEALARDGAATRTIAGGTKPSAELQAVDRLGKQLLGLLREFGLSPASRHMATPIVSIDRDPLDELLEGRRAVAGRI